MRLEDEYAGDKAWREFLIAHRDSPMSGSLLVPTTAHAQIGESEEAIELLDVATSYFGVEQLSSWLHLKHVALNDCTPWECICNSDLHTRLRQYLMELPC